MDLFSQGYSETTNLLPEGGEVYYFGVVMPRDEADHYFNELFEKTQWKNDEARIYGKHIITARKVAWYADQAYDYTYSGTTRRALPWSAELLELKEIVEKLSGHTFNSCLLNLYHTGDEGMAWHSDDERSLGKDGAIASFTFGAARKFAFKNKHTKQRIELILESGSLLLMKGETQTHWWHRLPPTKKVRSPRINLTFRNIVRL